MLVPISGTDEDGEEGVDRSEKIAADTMVDGDDIQEKLGKAIDTLPPKQKMVFQLRYYEEMKYEDIAQVVETSIGALKASYFHAAKKIEQYLMNN